MAGLASRPGRRQQELSFSSGMVWFLLGFALFSFFAFCFHSVISNICPFKISDVAEEVPTAESFASPAEMEQVLLKHP